MSGCEAKVPALRFNVTPAESAENTEGGRLSPNTGGRARTPVALWVRRRLADVAEFNPKCILPDSFEYVDLESVVGTEIITHRTESKTTAPSRAQRLAKYGDVFYQTVRPYQKNNCIFTLTDTRPFVFSTGYAQLRPQCDGYLLLSLLQNDSFVNSVLDECTGTSYPAINDSRLSDIPIIIPTDKTEQRRIGSFFRSLDALIAGREKALEKLEALKKSMLLKMFPQGDATVPEVRFKGFAGDWEKKRLGDIGFPYNGLSGKCKDDFGHGKGRYVTYMNVFSNPIAKTDQCDAIEIDKSQNEVKNGDVFFTTSSETPEEVGMSSVWMGDAPNVYLNSFCFGYRPKPGNVSEFLAYLLRANGFRKAMTFLAQGISRYNISKTRVMDLTILLPDKFEQQKIGAYFRSLDALLAARREEAEKLKQMKKALLERMFV